MAEPALLDLVTSVNRPSAKIDGETYQIKVGSDLSLGEHRRLAVLSPRLGRLMMKEKPTKAEDEELSEGLDEVCRLVLIDVPDRVHQRLGDTNRMHVFGLFTSLLTESLHRSRANLEASQSPGTRPSRDSRGSTRRSTRKGAPGSHSDSSTAT